MLRITELVVRTLQKLGASRRSRKAGHLGVGEAGETEAYFYLQRLGYRIVATNFRVPHDHGEIDLIGWDGDVLCFIEVKTRTDDSFAPPSAAVTAEKQRHLISVAKRYLRRLTPRPTCRFDIVSVVPAGGTLHCTLQRGAFSLSPEKRRRRSVRDFQERRYPPRR